MIKNDEIAFFFKLDKKIIGNEGLNCFFFKLRGEMH